MAKRYRLERSQFIPRPREEVFAFFSDARNLERLTPKFLDFRILTEGEIHVEQGTRITYRIGLHGIPIQWETLIETFVQNESFTDTQLRGPYRYWHHLHEFRDVEGGTKMHDVVDYELPLGPFGRIAHGLFVQRQLETIFKFRFETVADIFGADKG